MMIIVDYKIYPHVLQAIVSVVSFNPRSNHVRAARHIQAGLEYRKTTFAAVAGKLRLSDLLPSQKDRNAAFLKRNFSP
jgi:hypothetical protein